MPSKSPLLTPQSLPSLVIESFKKKHPELPVPNLTLIKSNCKIFVNGRVENPSWDSQSKEVRTCLCNIAAVNYALLVF